MDIEKKSKEELNRELTLLQSKYDALVQYKEHQECVFDISPMAISENDFTLVKQYFDQLKAAGVMDFRSYLSNHPHKKEEIFELIKRVELVRINPAHYRLYSVSTEEYRAALPFILASYGDDIIDEYMGQFVCLAEGGTSYEHEMPPHKTKEGITKHIVSFLQVAPGHEATLDRVYVFYIDVTERKNAEDQIRLQLDEKQILLKEVYHRLKNNMTSIENLLSIQCQGITNSDARESLQSAISRIISMRVIYDKMLMDESFTHVQVKEYFEGLVDALSVLFPVNTPVTINKQIGNFTLLSKDLFSMGIILNELITNVMKYAFRGRESGVVDILLQKADNRVQLVVQDNGIGLPQGFDLQKSTGLGLVLLNMLSRQMGGTFSMENHGGTRSVIEFPCIDCRE